MEQNISTFQVEERYFCRLDRSCVRYDTVLIWTVIERTAKFVTIHNPTFGTKRCKVRLFGNTECVSPLGSRFAYSMAPVVSATDIVINAN